MLCICFYATLIRSTLRVSGFFEVIPSTSHSVLHVRTLYYTSGEMNGIKFDQRDTFRKKQRNFMYLVCFENSALPRSSFRNRLQMSCVIYLHVADFVRRRMMRCFSDHKNVRGPSPIEATVQAPIRGRSELQLQLRSESEDLVLASHKSVL